ncbi:unnamed protein product [Fructobacillus fructosus]|uniref:SMODS-associating 2TM beta-strand rich effector domain-containing protein n=1 Tax=Fructobacillus fructosus TaxID=1631 RepID=A0ABN9YWC1_9LACO|nr:unnamed protein product [Fructobacillus fructosus]
MTTTFVLSILGSITGISSLLIQFSNYLRSRPKIKISTPEFYENWVFKSGYSGEWGYITKKDGSSKVDSKVNFVGNEPFYVFAVQLLISNNSSSPLTINGIKSPNPQIYSLNKYHFHLIDKLSDSDSWTVSVLNKVDFPIRIQPFDSVQTSIAFYSENTNIETNELSIIIHSAAGNKHFTIIDFQRYDEMMSHRQNEL